MKIIIMKIKITPKQHLRKRGGWGTQFLGANYNSKKCEFLGK
jgi:hypothetical protein